MTQGRFDDSLGAAYRLIQPRGRGAMGEVWEAVDRRTDARVAAKILRKEHVDDKDLISRFLRERSILTSLRHPGIVAVRDLVVEGDRLAIVMDFVDGPSLREVMASGPLTPAVAAGVVALVLDGLASAHASGVVHRDLKPDNVLLSSDWPSLQEGQVKLTDFGISRIVSDGAKATTGLLGTPEYMAPEMIVTGEAGLPADVYGVGILLYELLAARTPYAGHGTDYTVAHRHVTSEAPPLPLPDDFWAFLLRLLAKDPAQRPAAAEAAAALRGFLPSLADLPALLTQHAPADFTSAHGPATVVRGLRPDPLADTSTSEGAADDLADLDLGAPSQQTIVRALPRTPVSAPRRRRDPEPEPEVHQPWHDPRVRIGAALLALVVLGATAYAVFGGGVGTKGPTVATVAATASQQDDPTPTGLTVQRSASYDPDTKSVTLTLKYGSQRAPLSGPFLEVIPGLKPGSCPTITWESGHQEINLPTSTGITASCAWSVTAPIVTPAEPATVTATFALPVGSSQGLQTWLDSAAAATQAAVSDPKLTSTAYPVQRLQSIDVAAPDRSVGQKTLPVTLYPVWPNGRDALHPLYRSPSIGDASSMLLAVAGGEKGVRFSDGCSGGVNVSADGLVVTALAPTDQCTLNAQVGNFTDLVSNTFSIVTRGG